MINPIYRKELKLSTRSLKLPLFFTGYIIILTLIACFACTSFFSPYNYSESQYVSVIKIFICLAVSEFAMILLEIPAFTSDTIAGERERQTLDILLTTSLKPMQIVIGKLLSSLSSLFLLTILSLPVLGITFAIGGIHGKDLLELFLFILISMFFIGSIGIFCSAALKRTATATISSYAALLLITGGTVVLLLVASWISYLHAQQIYTQTGISPDINIGILPIILLINPAITMFYMMSEHYASLSVIQEFFNLFGFTSYDFIIQHWFFLSLLSQALLGILFLVLAARKIDPLNKKKEKTRTHRSKKQANISA